MSGSLDPLALVGQLSTLASGLASAADLRTFADEIERALEMLVPVEYSGLYLWDVGAERLRLFVARGFSEEERVEAERTAWDRHPGSIFRVPRTIHIPDTEADPRAETASSARGFAIRSRLFMPVMYRDQPLGVFGLASTTPHKFGPADIAVLQFLCRITGVIYRQLLDRLERERLRRELERARDLALAATRAKNSFLAEVSHELRTPLNAIIGYTELLLEDSEAPSLVGDLQRIGTSAQHLLDLVNDILDLAKIEAGKFTLHLEDLDLAALLTSVEAACRPGQRSNNNTYVREVEGALPRLRADATALRRVLINLLGNAHKFTRGGKISLHVGRDADAGRVVFVVRDTGIGMSDEQLQRIFDAFSQADPTISRRFGGTGLGLMLTRQLVRLMGGEISVTSSPGVGSAFTVALPG